MMTGRQITTGRIKEQRPRKTEEAIRQFDCVFFKNFIQKKINNKKISTNIDSVKTKLLQFIKFKFIEANNADKSPISSENNFPILNIIKMADIPSRC